MARTDLTVTPVVGPYPSLQPAALSLDITFAAADVANGNQFAGSGEDILLVWNDGGAAAYYFTATSKADALNRTGDITQYDVAIDAISQFKFKNLGWRQADGKIYLDAENASLKFAVLSL